MKRVIAILLAVLMVVSLCACGKSDSSSKNNKKVEEYVQKNKTVLLTSMEAAFAQSSGLTCTSSIEAKGAGFIIKININELDNLDAATKKQLQTTYDSMDAEFEANLVTMQKELPELEYYEVHVCEKDGDQLAVIRAGK